MTDLADIYWPTLWNMNDSDNPLWPMFTERVQTAMVMEMSKITLRLLGEEKPQYWAHYNTIMGNTVMFEPDMRAQTLFALTKDARSSIVTLFLDSLPTGTLRQ